MVNTWATCEEWLAMIAGTEYKDKKIVLNHNGFYWAGSEDTGNLITEEDYERVIKRSAESIMLMYEKTARYAKKQTNSYGGKHYVENKEGYYMTNGEFILASLCSGVLLPITPKEVLKGLIVGGIKKKMNLNIMLPMRLKKVG